MAKTLEDMADKAFISQLFTKAWWTTPSIKSNAPMATLHEDGPKAKASFGGERSFQFSYSYNGEKNLGEIGPIKDYKLDYSALRYRSWQAMLESEMAQTALKKFTLWIVGDGLKLQAEPENYLLIQEKIKLDPETFNNEVESRWGVWAASKTASHSGMESLHTMAQEAHKNMLVGGDLLVLLRLDEETNEMTVQLVDGAHVQSPMAGSEWWPQQLANGNVLINGIEMNAKGKHIAYYVRKALPEFGYERIEARKNGLLVAFLVYGVKYRLDNKRGMPILAGMLETLKKMERYKEATVGSAEERQKIVYQIIHGVQSTGESPLLRQTATAHNVDLGDNEDLPQDDEGRQLADKVAATTNKQTFNMPIDSELKTLESKNELYFKDFYDKNIDLFCASIGIPPNVAMSLYNDSFSASRAATKDWEHTIEVHRSNFTEQFYQPIYDFWLTLQTVKNKITAPGYLEAFLKNEIMVMEAYRKCRFTGKMFPHIDPLKEANAERIKLGPLGAAIPLTTIERATEVLQGGDSESNMRQFAKEVEEAKTLGLKQEPVVTALPVGKKKSE